MRPSRPAQPRYMRAVTGRVAAVAVAIAAAIATAGCGLGAGRGTSDVAVGVTRDFGSRAVARRPQPGYMRAVTGRVAAVAVAIAAAFATAGCGLGAGRGTSDVAVVVTRDFGSRAVARRTEHRVPGAETVLALLERSFSVSTRYGGGFVESIDGSSGTASRREAFYDVKGIQVAQGA